jgi:hypothetical protein
MFASLVAKCFPLVAAFAILVAVSTSANSAAAGEVAHGHYTVHYTPPSDTSIHLHNHGQAHRLARFLRSVGCRAHVHHDGHGYDVHYGGYGSRSRHFDCDQEAHAFEARLRGLGFSAHVHH